VLENVSDFGELKCRIEPPHVSSCELASRYNRYEQDMSTERNEKNIALAPEVLCEVEKLANSEHRTTDELMNEAAQSYLKSRGTIMELRSFVAKNREKAVKKGWTERSIASVVKKHRQEKRGLLPQTQTCIPPL